MIHCTVNGKSAVPSSTDKIKVTYANQYIEDSGSYTYDITFPMSIHANQVVFANVHRFDVHKPTNAFDDCKLFADNRLFISGKGTVTSVSDSAVKLQIVGGKSRIKYNSKFEQHYIDDIDYPDVKITSGIDAMRYGQMGVTSVDCRTKPSMVLVDLTNGVNVGQPGVALFYPIYDETHDCMSNYLAAATFDKLTFEGHKLPGGTVPFMRVLAVQPNLLYVLTYIIKTEGYTVIRNDYDCAPWRRLYIASARRSCLIKHALPHWSVYTFIEEFRKLFNASFVFDDVAMTVSIIATNELTDNEAVSYDCLDEYSAEYDEDGLSNLATSNVEYDFDDSTVRDWREFIPLSVLKQYPVLTYDNTDAMTDAASAMTVKERRSTIFKVGYTYYIWAMLPKNGGPESKGETEQRTLCGLFNPIMRDKEIDNVVDLKMIPVAMSQRKRIHSKMLLPFTDRIPVPFMRVLAVQPNLLYVLTYIIKTEGYTVIRNDYDCAPWRRLYIASARRSCLIKHALPHWSVYTFIEEFRKLFNASFVFDDVAMTVSIIATNELTDNEAVSYDCLDEYSAEYDEDGLSNLATSNVEYDFDDSTVRDWREFIPLSVLKQYPVLTYDNTDAMTDAASAMTVKERRSTIFKVGYTYYIWAMLPKNGGPESKGETEQRTLCGLFNPIMRDKEIDNVVDLKMIPVAMSQRKRIHSKMLLPFTDRIPNKIVCMPSMSNDKDTSLDNMTVDDDGDYYVSVQDAMQGADISSNEEDADEKIRLMFSGDWVRDLENGKVVQGGTFGNDNTYTRYPICLTDSRMYPKLTGVGEDVSLSLERMPYNNNVNVEIDTHNLYCVKFVTDDIPDPSKIYIFHNRRFVCQKIEMDVSNDGIGKLKTGYFYEML